MVFPNIGRIFCRFASFGNTESTFGIPQVQPLETRVFEDILKGR
jgi:hypothetical protein